MAEASIRSKALQRLVEEASALALVGAKEKEVKVEFDFPSESPLVFVNRVQIQQVLLNLIRNAIEAMQDVTPARIDDQGAGSTSLTPWFRSAFRTPVPGSLRKS